MPKGIPTNVAADAAYLQYNEVYFHTLVSIRMTDVMNLQYIVYDTSQIRIRYLLMVRTDPNY